jgi:hypothetical protein
LEEQTPNRALKGFGEIHSLLPRDPTHLLRGCRCIKAKHLYRLEPRNGATLVHTEESYEGGVTRLLRGSLQKTLDKALPDGLRYLKAETERRSPG